MALFLVDPTRTGKGTGTLPVTDIDTKLRARYHYAKPNSSSQPAGVNSKLDDLIRFLSENCKGVKQ